MPGQFIPGADSHSRAYGAYGAVGIGVGSTTLGFGWSTGYIYFTLAKQRRVVFAGRLQPWVSGKDIVLELLKRWGAKQSQGMSVELVDADRQLADRLSQHHRQHDGRGGSAEWDLRARRHHVRVVSRRRGSPTCRIRDSRPAPTRLTPSTRRSIWTTSRPMIAKPFSPGNAFPAEEVARERITFDKALIGSCTNGSYDDLLQAALVMRAAREHGLDEGASVSSSSSRVRAELDGRSSGPIRGSAASRSPKCSDRSAARSASRGAARASARDRTR